MKKYERLLKIKEIGIIAVVRKNSKVEGKRIAEALLETGISAIEITLTTPNAIEIITELYQSKEKYSKMIVGAGTVIEKEMALLAIYAGAEFIVSPVFDDEICKVCHFYQVPYIPGCMTVNEMKLAMTAGVDIIKLFPATHFSPSVIKDIKGPLPQINLMPSGGVTLNLIDSWLKEGAIAVSVGGDLTSSVEEVKKLSKLYLNSVKLKK